MSSNLKVNTILPSAGTAIGIGTAGGNLNVDGGCKVQVGTALTLGHTQGLQFHTQNLHSTGFEVNNVNASGIITATKFVGPFENTGDFTIDDYIVHAGDTDTKFGFSSADTFSVETGGTERFLIQSDGSIGINAPVPSAGDLASGDSQNKPLLHVNGSGASATTGEYNLLARFEAGGDADGTGAMIVLNHSNDRGLAIQGGRRTGNYAHGALKMIDNVGRVSDAMLIHGGAGQGVDHINFYTGISTITTNRLHIDNAGRVLIGTTNTSNGHVAASKATVHGHLSIFKDSGGDNAGVDSHQLKFVTQSGSIAEIMATSAGAGGPAGRGGYLSLFAKPNNSGTLKEMLRVTDTGIAIKIIAVGISDLKNKINMLTARHPPIQIFCLTRFIAEEIYVVSSKITLRSKPLSRSSFSFSISICFRKRDIVSTTLVPCSRKTFKITASSPLSLLKLVLFCIFNSISAISDKTKGTTVPSVVMSVRITMSFAFSLV